MAAGLIKRFRHRVEYGIVICVAAGLRHMSSGGFKVFSRTLGGVAYRFGVSKNMALKNLRWAFPEKTEKEIRGICLASYKQFGESMLDIARMPVMNMEKIEKNIHFEGFEIFENAIKAGKGVIAMSGHYGSWGRMGAAVAAKGYPLHLAMAIQSNPHVHQLFVDCCKTVAIQNIRIGNIRGMIKILKRNHVLAIMQDQDGDKWGIFNRFFGRVASTHTIVELLARKTGAALIFGVSRRLGNGEHKITIKAIPRPSAELGLNKMQTKAWLLQAYNDLLEKEIRIDPTQWLWMHHRWKAQPFHRLHGVERERAESGEIYFDTKTQQWREKFSGSVVEIAYWK